MQKILFFGELPPNTIHGASISNSLNIKMLNEKFTIKIVHERYNIKEHEKISITKLKNFLLDFYKFIKTSFSIKYDIFYGIVYLSTFGICKNIFLALVFKVSNPKSNIIFHFHRSDFSVFKSKFINNILFKLLNLLTNKFIVLSDKEKKNFNKNTNVYVLNNTIENEINFNELSKINKDSSSTIHLTYIGNFIVEKGIIELVNAVQEINTPKPIINLKLYGEYASNELKLILNDLINNDVNIQIFPITYGVDKFNIIYNSDLMLLPSYNEGLPITLLECLYIGTPIIISKVGYISDILGDDYPLYCEPKSVNSLKKEILKFCNKELIHFNSDVLHNYYKNYSHKVHRIQLLEIFNFT
jgi:glycosyltransferase involved in cell wall biosynthesis